VTLSLNGEVRGELEAGVRNVEVLGAVLSFSRKDIPEGSLKKGQFQDTAFLLLGIRKDEGVRCSPNS
jgi:hypothetical protein